MLFWIRRFNSSMLTGRVRFILHFVWLQRKKTDTEWSGDRAGHLMSPKRELCLCGSISLRTVMHIRDVWEITPSCWNHSRIWWRRCNTFCKSVSNMILRRSDLTVLASPSSFSKHRDQNFHRNLPHTTLILFHCADYVGEIHACCLVPNTDNYVQSHKYKAM